MRLSDVALANASENVSFALLGGEPLDKALSVEPQLDQLLKIYVHDRGTQTKGEKQRLNLLRTRFVDKYREIMLRPPAKGAELQLGEPELDILDFAFSKTLDNTLLNVLGPIGSGKTSLLRYTLECWLPRYIKHEYVKGLLRVDGLKLFDAEPRAWVAECLLENLRQLAANDSATPDYGRRLIADVLRNPAHDLSSVRGVGRALQAILRQGFDILVAFDNADQMHSDAVVNFLDAGTVLADEFGLRVYVPLRPSTYRRGSLHGRFSGARVFYYMMLEPPDLAVVLGRRVEQLKADGVPAQMTLALKEATSVTYEDATDYVHFVLDALAGPKLNRLFNGLAERNIRTAICYLLVVLGYHRINVDYFAGHYKGQRRIDRWGDSIPHYILIQGLMCQKWTCYSSRKHRSIESAAKIFNIYCRDDGLDVDQFFAPGYLLLRHIDEHRSGIEVDDVLRFATHCGQKSECVRHWLTHALDCRLLESPQYKLRSQNIELLDLLHMTDCGRYYLEELAKDPEYISWIALDQDIPIEYFERAWALFSECGLDPPEMSQEEIRLQLNGESLRLRVMACVAQLLMASCLDAQVLTRLETGLSPAILRALREVWPTTQFAVATERLCNDWRQSEPERTYSGIAKLVERIRQQAHRINEKSVTLERRLSIGPRHVARASYREVAKDRDRTMRVSVPDYLSAGESTVCGLEITSTGERRLDEALSMVAMLDLQETGGATPSLDAPACVPMTYQPDSRCYRGEFDLTQRRPGHCDVGIQIIANGATAGLYNQSVRGLAPYEEE